MTEASPEPYLLALEAVCAGYPGGAKVALDGVDLALRPGELAVLLGPNGAGKSTLIRVAAGLVSPLRGTVRLEGKGVETFERRDLARRMAVVTQSEAVAIGFTVRQVVGLGRTPLQYGWMRESAADHDATEEALARCDSTSLASRNVEALSGGEQRRVAVARALAGRPRVLLLDEPGAFLDVRHRLEQCDLLADLVARDRLACVVSMHDLDAAARIAHRVVLLREGRVVASGPPASVMTAPLLRATFDVDIDVGLHEPSGRRYFVAV